MNTVTKMTKFVSSTEAAKLLHVSRVTINRLIRDKELPAFCVGAQYRIDMDDIRSYLERNRTIKIAG